MLFNGISKSYLTVIRGRNRPAWSPMERNFISVVGMSGSHLTHSKRKIRQIDVPVFIKADNFSDLQKIKEDLAEWLIHDKPKELIFKDEPDRVYYAIVDGSLELDELVRWGSGTITFLCPDSYKYGAEQTFEFTNDNIILNNKGTAPAKPIFELTARKKSTFAMVANSDEKYNLVGKPADDEEIVIDGRTSILYENGSTLDEWSVANLNLLDSDRMPKIGGEMTTDGAGIRANGYGTGDKLHGPAIYKEITPIQDFEIETTFDIISRREIESWRMGINFLDENMNMIGHIGIKDNHRNYKRRIPLARYGPYRGGGRSNGNLIGDSQVNDKARETTLFYLRVKRQGDKFDFYIGEWMNQKHIRSWHQVYRDRKKEYHGRLKYITLYIASFSDRVTPARMRINSVELFELAQITEDVTPYIIYPGDTLTLDHTNSEILLNGEPRKDLKNFGSSFFDLKKGQNTIVVSPEDTFLTKIKCRDRYL